MLLLWFIWDKMQNLCWQSKERQADLDVIDAKLSEKKQDES